MEDLIKSIKASLYDRATSPLFGTFVVSWALWNYRIIFTLFSSMPPQEKFPFIENYLYYGWYTKLSLLALYPLLTTALFIFVYPYPARFTYKFWRNKQKELKEIKQKIEDEEPLTREESREIRRQLFELEIEHEKELEIKNNEISKLNKYIEEIQKTNFLPTPESEQQKSINDAKNQITDEQLSILEQMSDKAETREDHIINANKTKVARTKYNLGELKKSKLILENRKGYYSITHEGQSLLAKKGKI